MNGFLELPSTLSGWVTLIGFLSLGILQIYTNFSKQKKDADNEADQASDRVINLLKEQVDALEKKVIEQEQILKETKDKLDGLVNENRMLREVLQGRDDAALQYQQKALEVITAAPKAYEAINRIDDNVTKLLGSTVIETKTRKLKRI